MEPIQNRLKRDCLQQGGNLVEIMNEGQQKAFATWHAKQIDDYMATGKDRPWSTFIGMSDINSQSTPPQMEWITSGTPNYVNWVFGAPETQQGYWPGHTCAVIQKENYKDDVNWSAKAGFSTIN